MPSTGLHTSGHALARHLFFQRAGYSPDQYVNELKEKVGAILMRAHRSYFSPVRKLLQAEVVSGFAHITDGGLSGDLAHILPKGLSAQLDRSQWQPGPLFEHLAQLGSLSPEEMLQNFNMGIGLVATVPAARLAQARLILNRMNERHVIVGRVIKGDRRVLYC